MLLGIDLETQHVQLTLKSLCIGYHRFFIQYFLCLTELLDDGGLQAVDGVGTPGCREVQVDFQPVSLDYVLPVALDRLGAVVLFVEQLALGVEAHPFGDAGTQIDLFDLLQDISLTGLDACDYLLPL